MCVSYQLKERAHHLPKWARNIGHGLSCEYSDENVIVFKVAANSQLEL